MGRKDLIEHIKGSFANRADAERAVDVVFEGVTALVKTGETVQLRGFGTFSYKHRPAQNGVHPGSREPTVIPARDYIHFKAATPIKR